MLSILIPTFNYDCTRLVHELTRQAAAWPGRVEILVGDDASTDAAIAASLDRLPDGATVRLVRMSRNTGRAAIRNALGREARGGWLLFLDSDGLPPDGQFLERYVAAMTDGSDVICGGISHAQLTETPTTSLRYRYERQAERRGGTQKRNAQPYASFRSFNFMIRRATFAATGFDETLRGYGYEDVLFGHLLAEKGARVVHIDNPMLNRDLEDNETFLRKTEEALRTLAAHAATLAPLVRLSRHLARLRRMGAAPLVELGYRLLAPAARRHLAGARPAVCIFTLYKIAYLNHVWPARTGGRPRTARDGGQRLS